MSDIKLEVGQIWTGKDEHVRQIIFIGNTTVCYSALTLGSSENSLNIDYFKSECTHKLLTCWPEKKKVQRARAIIFRKYHNKPIVTNTMYASIEEANEDWLGQGEVHKWPYGEFEEFDE